MLSSSSTAAAAATTVVKRTAASIHFIVSLFRSFVPSAGAVVPLVSPQSLVDSDVLVVAAASATCEGCLTSQSRNRKNLAP